MFRKFIGSRNIERRQSSQQSEIGRSPVAVRAMRNALLNGRSLCAWRVTSQSEHTSMKSDSSIMFRSNIGHKQCQEAMHNFVVCSMIWRAAIMKPEIHVFKSSRSKIGRDSQNLRKCSFSEISFCENREKSGATMYSYLNKWRTSREFFREDFEMCKKR